MKITIESTTREITINGMPARVWQGTSAGGVPVWCAITRIAIPIDANALEFDAELRECAPPGVDAVRAFPLRMVL
jgi:hypothetical protein